MKRISFAMILVLLSLSSFSQFIYKIKADSVRIFNDNCNAELILENSTKNISGFLFNRGNGRTEFRKSFIQLSDSVFLFGADTLNLAKSFSGNYFKQGGNNFGNIAELGTNDAYALKFKTGGQEAARITTNRNLLLGSTVDSLGGNRLQVNGGATFKTRSGRFTIRDTSSSVPGLVLSPSIELTTDSYTPDQKRFIFGVDNAGETLVFRGVLNNTLNSFGGGYLSISPVGFGPVNTGRIILTAPLGATYAPHLQLSTYGGIWGAGSNEDNYSVTVGTGKSGGHFRHSATFSKAKMNLGQYDSAALSYIYDIAVANSGNGVSSFGGSLRMSAAPGFGFGVSGDVILRTGGGAGVHLNHKPLYDRFTIKGETGNVLINTTTDSSSYKLQVSGKTHLNDLLHINGTNGYSQLRLTKQYTPTSSSDANGQAGDVSWDDNYIYVKTSGGWKRSALQTF
ncbi:MAG: hypothetical protein ACO1NW_18565 [Chitinophagaceae bacterium]